MQSRTQQSCLLLEMFTISIPIRRRPIECLLQKVHSHRQGNRYVGQVAAAKFRSPTDYAGEHSVNRLSAVAWDLFLFRWCETLMT